MCAIAGEERFVGEQNGAMLQVGVEVSRQVLGVNNVAQMGAEQSSKFLCGNALAGSFFAPQYDRDLALMARELDSAGHPVEGVFIVPDVTIADIFFQVREIQPAICLFWLDSKAGPEI